MTTRRTKRIERRLFWIGAGLVALGTLLSWPLFGLRSGVSFLAGGSLAAINLFWLQQAVGALVFEEPKRSKRRLLGGFFLRLLLIPLALYAMMRFLFLNVPAAVAGLAVFYCSVFVEGILEAVSRTSK